MNDEKQIMDELIEKFKNISSRGWIESNRSHNTGIGKTFEDLLEKEEDNLAEPDYKGIEIKTHRSESNSYTTLFTCAPDGPEPQENSRLREKFGQPDKELGQKTLHTSMWGNRANSYFNKYKFKLDVDRTEEKVYIAVYDNEDNLIERTTYWTFDKLYSCLERKLRTLAFVTGKSRTNDKNKEEFLYEKLVLYKFKTLDGFLTSIENGTIMVDLRIGFYKSGSNFGKTHDHGTGFRIKDIHLQDLYELICQTP